MPDTVTINDDEGSTHTHSSPQLYLVIDCLLLLFFFAFHYNSFFAWFSSTDVTSILLMNNSPQIFGRDVTVDYTIDGCAQISCGVRQHSRRFDCKLSLPILCLPP